MPPSARRGLIGPNRAHPTPSGTPTRALSGEFVKTVHRLSASRTWHVRDFRQNRTSAICPVSGLAGCLPYPRLAGLTNPYIGYKTPYIGYDKPYISYDKPYISYLPTVHQLSIHRVTHCKYTIFCVGGGKSKNVKLFKTMKTSKTPSAGGFDFSLTQRKNPVRLLPKRFAYVGPRGECRCLEKSVNRWASPCGHRSECETNGRAPRGH